MIDLAQLATFLAPFMGYLLAGSKELVDKGLEQLARQGFEHAKAMWQKLWPKLREKPSAAEAAKDVALKPNDPRARASLELQLEKVLAEDPDLARAIEDIWREAQEAGVVTVTGSRNVVTGGSVQSSVIVTGDHTAIRHQ